MILAILGPCPEGRFFDASISALPQKFVFVTCGSSNDNATQSLAGRGLGWLYAFPLQTQWLSSMPDRMELDIDGPIGLIADSHGRNDLLNDAILMLEDLGAESIIHLGDICDSLAPLALEDAVAILKEHNVRSVKGNNEYAILTNHMGQHANSISPEILSFLSEMPYTITLGEICFAHSAPFNWPAATSWPITDNHPLIDIKAILPYKILFRGHSHTPSIMEINGTNGEKIPAEAGMKKKLSRNSRYVITVGAVEEASCALFLPREYEVWFLRVGRS